MDDSTPRHAEGGGGPNLRLLKPVTVLAEPNETEAAALENWARGLDWVHWLFSSLRQRMPCLYLKPEGTVASRAEWAAFTGGLGAELGRQLVEAWQAAVAGDAEALQAIDRRLSETLPADVAERSLRGGELLLRSTRGARYQGVLGRLRTAHGEGRAPGHFLTVWAAAGEFFQLSAANVIAEYLRLEWSMARRDAEPPTMEEIATVTSRLLKQAGPGLQLLGEAETAPVETATTPS